MERATMSVAPPGANGTTTRTDRTGYGPAARPGAAARAAMAPPASKMTRRRLQDAVLPLRAVCSTLRPRGRRKPRHPGGQFIGPDHDLFAILPLDGNRLVRDLVPTFVDRKIAE